MKRLLAGLAGALLPLPLFAADQAQPVPPGTPVTITVVPAAAAAPPVSILLNGRHGHVTPHRQGCTHSGGGNILVEQPTPDTLVITMAGVVVATGHPCKPSVASMEFDLEQCFEIVYDDPKVKRAKLIVEGRVIGLLRSDCKGKGTAEQGKACAAITCGPAEVISLCVPPHSVAVGEALSINCHEGPVSVPATAAKYVLHQQFSIIASHDKGLGKAASAEFAPDPALDPLWISYKEPFHGAQKGSFGFQIVVRVVDDTANIGAPAPAGVEPVPPPQDAAVQPGLLPQTTVPGRPEVRPETKPAARPVSRVGRLFR